MVTMAATRSSNLFITGCDRKTQWQLPWFIENFRKHNPKADLLVFDFGMRDIEIEEDIKPLNSQDRGWFKKPSAMMKASLVADKVCWLDTDCHVLSNLDGIFDYTVPLKLSMAQDDPWTTRSGEMWHNSGVVVFQQCPPILSQWATEVAYAQEVGDQEVLHRMVGQGLERMPHIQSLPKQYNTLRLDVVDQTTPPTIKVMHWTGLKGNDHIRGLIDG
jgi:hypothetical protein